MLWILGKSYINLQIGKYVPQKSTSSVYELTPKISDREDSYIFNTE